MSSQFFLGKECKKPSRFRVDQFIDKDTFPTFGA
jgi:hypothetical protein